ncbi:MAG TPA: peptide deformylase [Actinomycetota bacterium]|nr:peptide deformylase [Actinomycetota bacterium]
MAVLPIRQWGDPVLRARAREVERVTDGHRRLAADMLDTMRDAPGVGLAGPQVGVSERIFVWELDDEHGVVINPVISVRSAEEIEDEEGCLSMPGLLYPVVRHQGVVVEGIDESGAAIRIDATDLLARIFQHEIDHLDGTLFIDRLEPALKREALAVLRDRALGFASGVGPPAADGAGAAL